MADWTFKGLTIYPQQNGVMSPGWLRDPKIEERHLIGTEVTEVNLLGYLPYKIEMDVDLPASASATFIALQNDNRSLGTLTDNASVSYSVILLTNSIIPRVGGTAGWAGRLVFIRPTP